MSYETISVAVAARIATLTVNRPDKLNALSERTMTELGLAIADLVSREDVGGIILTGAGRAFVAGADIEELDKLTGDLRPRPGSPSAASTCSTASSHRPNP